MLRIFQTKKAEYNELVLKSLVFGPKTTNQIAKYIYLNRKAQIKPKKVDKNEIKKIVSIISRKNSRLEELQKYHYICRKNALWHLTHKGFPVALTRFDSINDIIPYIKPDSDLTELGMKIYEASPIIQMLVTKDTFIKWCQFAKSPEYIMTIREYTNELIKQGVNIDDMSEAEFRTLLSIKLVRYFTNRPFIEMVDELEETLEKMAKISGEMKKLNLIDSHENKT
jgi:nucleoside diphosphate kinase